MITFKCPACLKPYSVPDASGGRKAKCGCGHILRVPWPDGQPAALSGSQSGGIQIAMSDSERGRLLRTPTKLPVRTRRLIADAAQMKKTFADFPAIQIGTTVGDPPESYQILYTVTGLERGKDGKPVPREQHVAVIQLTSEYPRVSPMCKMLTPIFHPNVDEAAICVGDHWTAGERLIDLVMRIGEMIAYQDYNIKSPLNAEAAMWADLNGDKLPIDRRNLRPANVD